MLAAPGAPGLLLASLCYALSGIGPTAFLAVYLVEAHGLSVAASGLALGALSAVRVLGNRASARFADRQGHQRAVLAGLGGIALGYVVLAIPGGRRDAARRDLPRRGSGQRAAGVDHEHLAGDAFGAAEGHDLVGDIVLVGQAAQQVALQGALDGPGRQDTGHAGSVHQSWR